MENLKTKELKAMARDLGVKGWYDMTKAQLIEEIGKVKDVEIIVPDAPKPAANVNTLNEEENVPEAKSDDQEHAHKKNKKRLIEYKGKTQTLTAWAKELGIRHQTLYNRIVMKGWDIELAFETPLKKGGKNHDDQ